MTLSIVLCLLAPAAHAQTVPGVAGSFTDGSRTVRFAAATPNFYLDAGESIHPALDPRFEGEWTGSLRVLANAEYEFSHDVTIDGRPARKHTLSPGEHRFAMRYRREPGVARLRLEWRSAAFDWEPVPRSAFSHSKANEPAEDGRALVFDARCANCHSGAGLERRTPTLDAIGSRTSRNWLYAWLRKHSVSRQTEQQSADLAEHLSRLHAPAEPKQRRANEVAIGKGGELFGTIGCVYCHPSTSMQGLGSKYKLNVLADVLQRTHRPSMPLNDEDATALAAYLVRSTDADYEKPAPAGDAGRGAALLSELGCVGCHEQKRDAPPLAELKSDACRRVQTNWNETQRQSVRAFLNASADRSPAPVYEFAYRLRSYNCLGCHTAGTEAPPLEGAGEKLKTAWIGDVLWGRRRIRHGRELRMPHYDEAEMKPWLASFAKVEGVAPGDGAAPPAFAGERRATGIGLLGTNPAKRGMACIGCHDWGENKALGEEGPQLIDAAARMRFEWFERWMRNPARILSGTSMPNYFAGQPAERARETIHTMWAGMALGAKAPVPDGYRVGDLAAGGEAKPVPDNEAIVVRWDMPEATPAAIAVGLPGGFSYCFDAGPSRLLYAWRAGFLDLSGTLLRKTDKNKLTPTAAIVGEIFWRSAEFPIRVGAEKRVPQRKFKGYRLTGGVPVLRYQVDGVDVFEKLTASGGVLVREIVFSRVDQAVFFEGREVPRGTNVKMESRLGQ